MLLLLNLSRKWMLMAGVAVCVGLSNKMAFAAPDTLAQQTSRDFTAVAKKAIPAVVTIRIKANSKSNFSASSSDDLNELFNDDFLQRFLRQRQGSSEPHSELLVGQASGFIVSADGYVLTNSHVVRNASEIIVILNDGRELVAKVVGQDPNTDIAVVKIDAKDLPFLQLGDSTKLEIGEWVVAIGNPMGLQASLTVGVISALGRNDLDIANVEDFIQTDAAINRGNSGGPLLNLDSKVIGMNTAIATNTAMGNMGLGFAIPSNMIKPIMEQIVRSGSVTRGFIGVTLQTIDKDLAQVFHVEHNGGALISSVTKESPAEKAGLKQGDIVRAYNGHKVSSIASLRGAISLMTPGSTVSLTVLRDGKTIEIPVAIAAFPKVIQQSVVTSGESSKLGFDVQDLTAEAIQSLGLTDERGVVITKVNPGTPAAWAGLKKGALLMAINQKKIESVSEFKAITEALQTGAPIVLLVKQGDTIRFISLRLG